MAGTVARSHSTMRAWRARDMPPVSASGGIEYDWPSGLETRGLRVEANDQKVSGDLRLAGGLLVLKNLRWQDGETAIAEGSASLPVPEDFSKWRQTLAHDSRPLGLSVESKVLSLGLLKDWLPAAAKLDPRATGMVAHQACGHVCGPGGGCRDRGAESAVAGKTRASTGGRETHADRA